MGSPIHDYPVNVYDYVIYCLKCRKNTDSEDIKEDVITINNKPRRILKATCTACKKKKSRFLKNT